ncbi:7-cyano-7-deazaguanine/7-aminomethyl-7-deazaguanine transporter [Endozoicomonas sp. Mp262]|uniref:7-cyano-7-deazaguanine/7-aminomethyl-7- deazaguanine transporter n=1 Tax=Endozoicomonas sp. Mp262 TaxID=2919499 RepID=UPI0021DA90E3
MPFPASLNSTWSAALNTAPPQTLWVLVSFHIAVITLSNYLVQIPVDIAGYHNTWGTFSFPLVYMATDLTVRIYGSSLARRIIARVMFPALVASYTVSVMFQTGQFQGIQSITTFSLEVARIAFASFSAYVAGQFLDVTVFNHLRKKRQWWLAPAASSIVGNGLDTLVFYWVAFFKSSDPFMASHWVEIGTLDYLFKNLIGIVFALPLYGVLLAVIQRYITLQYPAGSAPSIK